MDLALLFVLVRFGHVNYLVSTILSFLTANGLGYFLARRLVFDGTTRNVRAGLVYFLAIAALSAVALAPLMWLFVDVMHAEVILSRIIAASIVGVGGYVMNAVFNFKVGRPQAAAPAETGERPAAGA